MLQLAREEHCRAFRRGDRDWAVAKRFVFLNDLRRQLRAQLAVARVRALPGPLALDAEVIVLNS
eukprot:COSAG02_NODE_16092_length_1114_cov_0.957635_1_plen_64_part_00